MSDKTRRDSYLAAYMETQSTTETSVGVVYPDPVRTYGPPQHKPLVYYGPPSVPPGPLIEYPGSRYPILETMLQLPEKLEFLPKLITSFLGVTKILLKVVLLKLILKFVIMFCLFFFLPKLDMLDMVTEPDRKPITADSSSNNTSTTMEDQEEGRLNQMTSFVLDSVENQSFLRKYCNDEYKLKCKIIVGLKKLDEYATTSRLMDILKSESSNFPGLIPKFKIKKL